MLSLGSLWLRSQIHLARPVLSRFDARAGRAAQDQLGRLGARVLRGVTSYEPVAGWPTPGRRDMAAEETACWAIPRERRTGDGVILYLHGGGYVAGSLEYARLFGGLLAARCGLPTFCLAYALAPEHPYPAALEDALTAYRWLLDMGYDGRDIVIAGESAGGGLTLGLVRRLIALGLSLPAGLVCISPWTDLTLSGASITYNAHCDISLTRHQLEYYVNCYAPNDITAPEVSPGLYGFEGFPPALVFAGGDELLLDDARAVLRGYVRAGGPCRLVIRKGMWHAYPLYPTREAREALELIEAFVHRRLAGDALEG